MLFSLRMRDSVRHRIFSRIMFHCKGTARNLPWLDSWHVHTLDESGSRVVAPIPASMNTTPCQAAGCAHTTIRWDCAVCLCMVLAALIQDKLHSSSILPVKRGNSIWREEKTLGLNYCISISLKGWAATIACCDSRLLQPGGIVAGLGVGDCEQSFSPEPLLPIGLLSTQKT